MLQQFQFKKLLSGNFGFTALAKFTDLLVKFGLLVFFMLFRSNSDLVLYTYFLSLGSIFGAIFDWGGARYNVRLMTKSGILPLNTFSIFIAIVSGIIIYYFDFIKFYDYEFLILCIVYGLCLGWVNTFVKYYEYIHKNSELYKVQVIINLISSVIISGIIIFHINLYYSFIILILGNILLLIKCFIMNKGKSKFGIYPDLLYKGLPFLINTLAVMAFSQINIVILNQFGSESEISNFVLAQRIIEVSLMLPNSYTSSVIGRFFKGEITMKDIQQKTSKLWLFSFFVCLFISVIIKFLFPKYDLVIYLFLLLIPLGFVRSMSMSYSVVLDYTKYYLVRTITISVILILNLIFAKYVIGLDYGIYLFSLYIGVLISFLYIVYKITFKKYNIYEMFRH